MVNEEVKNSVEMKLTEKNAELKQRLGLQDNFCGKRHDEKVELVLLRQKFAVELITLRDKVSLKRHSERIEILNKKFNI